MSEPIFIHSLFRSSSTYLFEVFRRAEDHYFCFQEPFHEELIKLNTDPEKLLDFDKEAQVGLRHPKLQKPYFYEFTQIRENLQKLFDKDFSYQQYFTKIDDPDFIKQKIYIQTLIEKSRARPVLQFCRSSGRIEAIKNSFPGIHIHLWREPRNQWWSYNINNYFIAATQLIYFAKNLPEPLSEIKKVLFELNGSQNKDFIHQLYFAYSAPPNSRDSYLIFYALWLYSFINLTKNTNFDISIDELAINTSYRNKKNEELNNHGVNNINLDDCSSSFFIFSSEEKQFFLDIEDKVHSIFILSGILSSDINLAIEKSNSIRKIHEKQIHKKDFQSDAIKARSTLTSRLDDSENTSYAVRSLLEQEALKEINKEVNKRNEAEANAKIAEQQLLLIFQSYSWRLTKPIRYFSKPVRQSNAIFRENLTMLAEVNLKEFIIRQLVSLKLFLSRYPVLKELILKVFSIHPRFKQRLKSLSVEIPATPKEYRQLSPRGRLIYKQLKNPNKKQEIS